MSFLISSFAIGKGFLARGTYEGTMTNGQVVRFTFEELTVGSTTTVITDCNYPNSCKTLNRVEIPKGMKMISLLDYLVLKETYDQGFGVTFGAVGPRRVVYPHFNLFMRSAEDDEMTFFESEGAEKVLLRKISQ
jgi:hypothetical protein